jgi:hypothetical protein
MLAILFMSRRALWFFQRVAPGEIRRITNPIMQRFLTGERGLPHDGDGFVRCIGMSLDLHDRKLAQVSRIWFSKIRVGEDGRVDPHHRHETVKLAQAEVQQMARAESSVVVAGHRFAARRLSHLAEWHPEERDLQALRAVVNTRAGKEML